MACITVSVKCFSTSHYVVLARTPEIMCRNKSFLWIYVNYLMFPLNFPETSFMHFPWDARLFSSQQRRLPADTIRNSLQMIGVGSRCCSLLSRRNHCSTRTKQFSVFIYVRRFNWIARDENASGLMLIFKMLISIIPSGFGSPYDVSSEKHSENWIRANPSATLRIFRVL